MNSSRIDWVKLFRQDQTLCKIREDAQLSSRLTVCGSMLYFLVMASRIWKFHLSGIGSVPNRLDNQGSTVPIRTRLLYIAWNVWICNRQVIACWSVQQTWGPGWSPINLVKVKYLWLSVRGISTPFLTKRFSLLVEQWTLGLVVLGRQYLDKY